MILPVVLDKVDRNVSPAVSDAIDQHWEDIKLDTEGNAVFWEFLKKERDLLAHQYEHSAVSMDGFLLFESGERQLLENGEPLLLEQDFFLLNTGKFRDDDGRDVMAEAVKWVEERISEIGQVLVI